LELAPADAIGERVRRHAEALGRLLGRERPHLGHRHRDGLDDHGTKERKRG